METDLWQDIHSGSFLEHLDEVVYVCSANCQSLYDWLELRFGGLGVFHQTSVLTCLFSLCNMQEEVHSILQSQNLMTTMLLLGTWTLIRWSGWFNCLFISYPSLHECEQVYMRVNSCDLLCNVAYKSWLRMLVDRWEAYLLAGVFFRTRETQICT
jgi:hypothetical protein